MSTGYWKNRRPAGGRAGRGAMLLGTLFAVTAALTLSTAATAGAAGSFGPHGGVGSSASGAASSAGHVDPSSTVAPLMLANIVVTDLSTGNATVYSSSTITPDYPPSSAAGCNQSPTSPLCVRFGDPSTSPYTFDLQVPSPGLLAGAVYDNPSMSVAVPGGDCGTLFDTSDQGTVTTAVEVDQYNLTTTPQAILNTVGVQFDCTNDSVDISGTIAYNIIPTNPDSGYYVFGQEGELTGFGNDNYLTYLDGAQYYDLNAPIVGMAPTPDGGGYWMVGSDGGVYASGDAQFYGSTGSLHLNKPIVGMAATPDGKGYWFVGSDGGIFAYGDAQFYGSTGSLHLNKPIVGMAATPSGNGYWLVASDGGIFAYGDAQFYGSTGSLHLNKPVVGMAPTPDGGGYWFVASDGGIFAYGDAKFYGSTGSLSLNEPIVGMTPTPDGSGYWFTASDGGVFNYGSAGFDGSLGGSDITDVAGMSLGM
jgi:hypothetical protein